MSYTVGNVHSVLGNQCESWRNNQETHGLTKASAITSSRVLEDKYTMYMKNLLLRADLFMGASPAST